MTSGRTTDTVATSASGPVLDGSDGDVAVLRALADTTRLRLLRLLCHEELNVQELCQILESAQPTISRHLGVLRATGLVVSRREGAKSYYRLREITKAENPLTDYIAGLGEGSHDDTIRMNQILAARALDVRSFADRKAAQWDDIGKVLHSTAASLLALANMVPRHLTIADLGTGTGLLLPFLAEMGEIVYAVDQSEAMLKRARERCRNAGLTNIRFLHGAIEEVVDNLPPCDAILLHFVLHQMARPGEVIRRVAEGLAPEGRLVVVDRLNHDDERARELFGSVWLGFTEQQVCGWCREAGFSAPFWHLRHGTDPVTDAPFPVFIAGGARNAAANVAAERRTVR